MHSLADFSLYDAWIAAPKKYQQRRFARAGRNLLAGPFPADAASRRSRTATSGICGVDRAMGCQPVRDVCELGGTGGVPRGAPGHAYRELGAGPMRGQGPRENPSPSYHQGRELQDPSDPMIQIDQHCYFSHQKKQVDQERK